ncbi:MAG: CDP-alcohol phosphatidyltransferase family protein [archaeon]
MSKLFSKKLKEAVFSRGKELGRTGFYGKFDNFMRYVTFGISSVLVLTPITGNQISMIGALFNLLSAAAFAMGNLKFYILAFVFLILGELADWVDGTVARYRNEKTVLQANFLGRTYHILTLGFIIAGIGVGVYRNTGNTLYLLAGFWAAMIQQTTIYFLELKTTILLENTKNKYKSGTQVTRAFVNTDNKELLVKIFVLPIDYFWIKFILLAGIIFNILHWIVLFYAVYLTIRAMIFFYFSYYILKKIETGLNNSEK